VVRSVQKRSRCEDLAPSGRPSTSATEVNIAKVKDIVTDNPHSTLREIATELSVSHKSIHTILTNNLNMCLVAARLVLIDINNPKRSEFSPKTQSHESHSGYARTR
jgi:hypothetical protein